MPEPLSPGKYRSPDEIATAELEAVEKEVAAQPEKAGAEKKDEKKADNRTPAERWAENLQTAKLTEAQALKILDDICGNGYFEREYSLFHGRLTLTLRTREAYSRHRVAKEIDSMRNPLQETASAASARIQLAGSISRYQMGTQKPIVLPHPSPTTPNEEIEKAFLSRLTFVDGIPDQVIGHVYACLAHFDGVVWAALSEGSAENF
jgi:hypothetical protein